MSKQSIPLFVLIFSFTIGSFAYASSHEKPGRISVKQKEASAPRELSRCGKRVALLQDQIYRALYSSYESFKHLKLSRPGLLGIIDLKKRKITKMYASLMEDMLLDSNPELLCQNGELYYEETMDAITGASRKSTPDGYLLKLKAKLNELYTTLYANKESMRLDDKQFELLLASEIHPAYASLKKLIETEKANFHLANDP